MKNNAKTMKSRRSDPRYIGKGNGLVLNGNKKLQGTDAVRYMQFNLPAVRSCPFASEACLIACYARFGLHCMPSVKNARENGFRISRDIDFVDRMAYTIDAELHSRRYSGKTCLFRLHESGDFYNQLYMNDWIEIMWRVTAGRTANDIVFHFYTKSTPYLLNLSAMDRDRLNCMMAAGTVVIDLSLDDSFTPAAMKRVAECRRRFPLCNTYYFTPDTAKLARLIDRGGWNACDCADCGTCRKCSRPGQGNTAVRQHG